MNDNKDFFRCLKKLSLLYVEDDDNTREELEYFLRNKVKELYVAKNGQEGLEFFEKYQPDLIITDIQMPVMDGLELIKQISKYNNYINCIILSGHDDFAYAKE